MQPKLASGYNCLISYLRIKLYRLFSQAKSSARYTVLIHYSEYEVCPVQTDRRFLFALFATTRTAVFGKLIIAEVTKEETQSTHYVKRTIRDFEDTGIGLLFSSFFDLLHLTYGRCSNRYEFGTFPPVILIIISCLKARQHVKLRDDALIISPIPCHLSL